MALSKDEITNLTRQTIMEYNLEEKHYENLKRKFETHGDQPFYMFRFLSFAKNFLMLSKVGKYTIKVPSRREQYFLNRLTDSCFIQVKNRRVEKAELRSEYYNEIFLTVGVFR